MILDPIDRMATNWGGLVFEQIERLSTWDPPTWGGIYAIIFKKDSVNKPDSDTILYFGETNNFATRGINDSHHKYNCWKSHAHQTELYISVARVFTDGLRKNAEQQLITQYKPVCNEEFI